MLPITIAIGNARRGVTLAVSNVKQENTVQMVKETIRPKKTKSLNFVAFGLIASYVLNFGSVFLLIETTLSDWS